MLFLVLAWTCDGGYIKKRPAGCFANRRHCEAKVSKTHRIDGYRKRNTTNARKSEIVRMRVFDCHLSLQFSFAICRPTGDKMAIENTVSSDF